MSLSDAPMLKPENYEKWKNNMILHLEAISDEMITVIQDGPIKIQIEKSAFPVSNGKDREGDTGKDDAETSITPPGSQDKVTLVDKPRSQWTSEEAKRYRLDGQTRNIIDRD